MADLDRESDRWSRLGRIEDGRGTFRHRDSRNSRIRRVTLPALDGRRGDGGTGDCPALAFEFLRRFLQHNFFAVGDGLASPKAASKCATTESGARPAAGSWTAPRPCSKLQPQSTTSPTPASPPHPLPSAAFFAGSESWPSSKLFVHEGDSLHEHSTSRSVIAALVLTSVSNRQSEHQPAPAPPRAFLHAPIVAEKSPPMPSNPSTARSTPVTDPPWPPPNRFQNGLKFQITPLFWI